MDWDDSPQQSEFRAKVRTFFDEHLPERYRGSRGSATVAGDNNLEPHIVRGTHGENIVVPGPGWASDRLSEDPQIKAAADDWAEALASEGYVSPAWPRELGGAGLTTNEQFIFNEERDLIGGPRVGGTGAMFLGSLLMVHGTEEHRAKYMPAIARGEVDWAQGYSEPGAGSDLGSIALRAVRDGDDYVLNGQKIWSTPQSAEAMYALVRTDPDAPKHRGISFLMIDDLRAPGVEMRPIMNACWDEGRFGETFFADARVPAENLIGEENRGWYVAMTLMDFDRASISGTNNDRGAIRRLLEYAQTDEGRRTMRVGEPTVRAAFADRMIEVEVGRNLSLRLAWMQASGLIPNYEASMGKVFSTELHQRTVRTVATAGGLYTNLWPGSAYAPIGGECADGYVRTIPETIAGGSSEIQRNVIAGRGLGLPRG